MSHKMTETDQTNRQQKIANAAERALTEAEARHARDPNATRPVELGGRDGPEPTRFSDWEKKGIASDF